MSEWKALGTLALISAFVEEGANVSFAELAAHLTARDQIVAKYGQPGPEYQKHFCVIWEIQKEFPWFPAVKLMINKDFQAKLRPFLQMLVRRGLQSEIKTFDGCYNNRLAKGLKVISLHAYALAWDLNAKANPLHGPVRWSNAFLQTVRDAGLYTGADWKRLDGMHIALYNG